MKKLRLKRRFLILLILSLIAKIKSIEASPHGYSVNFQGVENFFQKRALKDSSNLIRYKKNHPRSLAALQFRANSDIPQFMDVLHGYGYYDAYIDTRTVRKENGKYKIIILVDKKEPYMLDQFNLISTNKQGYDLNQIDIRELGISLNRASNSQKIVDAQIKLKEILSTKGYPLAKITIPDVVVDQAQKSTKVNLDVDSGPKTYFGKTSIEKGKGVKERFIKNRIFWQEGELYNSEYVKKTEKALYDSGLFAVVNITPENKVDENNTMPINIELTDAKYNALILGGSYTTTWGGLGGTATWQNRNIFRSGTNLKLNYNINQKSQGAGLEFMVPDFLSPYQTLAFTSNIANNREPNYDEKAIKTDLYVERELGRYFTAALGGKFDQLETSETNNNGFFSLFGIPMNAHYQSSDMVLINPRQGGWFTVNFNPYFSMRRNDGSFAEIKFEGSVYQYLIPSKRLILAMNTVVGSLFGESNFDIPTPYRYFAGSPDHLRGYPYQSISPLDGQLKPIGGRSLFLWSIEPRWMILKPLEIVGFYEVGNVYRNVWPDFRIKLAKSIGVGVRFFSFVGPLRLDVAFPLVKRPNVKDKYQIHFSIGQAF